MAHPLLYGQDFGHNLYLGVDSLKTGFPGGTSGKESTWTAVECQRPGEDPLDKGMATHSSILA